MLTSGTKTDEEIKKGLKDYIQQILNFGVESKNVHFVVSSGAQKENVVKRLIGSLQQIGYVVNPVSPEQEGQLALRCVLPKEYEKNSFIVDIGSGNTKISYMENGKAIGLETLGAKFYEKNVSSANAQEEVKQIAIKIPADKRQYGFIIGGVPFEMAKSKRAGEERYTVLPTKISEYDALVKEKGKKVESGLVIFDGIVQSTQCKKFIFDWDANFTIGFLLELPY